MGASCEPRVAFWLRALVVAVYCADRGIGSPRVGDVDTECDSRILTGEKNLRRWHVHRRSVRTAVVGLAAVAALTLAACGSKSAETTSTSAGASGSAASGSAAAGGGGLKIK